jgi:hypothetical protein
MPKSDVNKEYYTQNAEREVSHLQSYQGSNFIAAIDVEGEQNAVDNCGNGGNFLPYSAIFIYYSLCVTILILEFRC